MRPLPLKIRIAAGLFVPLTILAACSGKPRGGPVRPTTTPTTMPGVRLVYETDIRNGPPYDGGSDLWTYDYPSDSVTRLTADEGRNNELMPRFHDDRITFITAALKKLVELDPATKQIRTVVTTRGAILAYAWHGDELAYIDVNYETNSVHYLRVLDTRTGEKTTVKRLGAPLGRGTGLTDVLSLAWSKDGARILLSDTHLDEFPTVRLIDRSDGADVITPLREATNAIWSLDESSLYVRLEQTSTRSAGWVRIDIAAGSKHPLPLDATAHHATLSPDGKSIAVTVVDKAKETYGVDVFDLSTGKSRRVVTGSVDAVWIGNDSFVATQIEVCSTNTACRGAEHRGEEPYDGRGAAIYRLDGTRANSNLVSTFWDLTGRNNTDVREETG